MRLLVITDTGEQVEAKCAECRHYASPTWSKHKALVCTRNFDDCGRAWQPEPSWGCADFERKEPA